MGAEHSLKINQTSEPLPLEKLQQQVAILFNDRVLLFEGMGCNISVSSAAQLTTWVCTDDIRDLGEIYVEVRIQTLKMLDTRYYHEFGDDFVWRDNEVRESTIADIKRVTRAALNCLKVTLTLDVQVVNARKGDQYDAPVELSGDVVYGMLRPITIVTEKILLVQSS
ncbi:TIP41-like protein [Phytophthora citrophthora]|uniref:TIP41-like protein n=1 Tax=Phytophthora citrophthora TaxID=4793 RepID=A0AAD9GJK1_9STRA|nr:TIP41-like protein [Phytophthora citrophthora]